VNLQYFAAKRKDYTEDISTNYINLKFFQLCLPWGMQMNIAPSWSQV